MIRYLFAVWIIAIALALSVEGEEIADTSEALGFAVKEIKSRKVALPSRFLVKASEETMHLEMRPSYQVFVVRFYKDSVGLENRLVEIVYRKDNGKLEEFETEFKGSWYVPKTP